MSIELLGADQGPVGPTNSYQIPFLSATSQESIPHIPRL